MKPSSTGILINKAGHNNYTEPSAPENLIRYILRENENPDNDLIAHGGAGVMEFLGTESIIQQFHAVQQTHTRKGNFGRRIDHEIYSLSREAEQLLQDYNVDIGTIAQDMADDIFENDHCQVIYGVHRPSGKDSYTHIHFAVNTVNYINGNKRRENKKQTREREARFQKIVADKISRAR